MQQAMSRGETRRIEGGPCMNWILFATRGWMDMVNEYLPGSFCGRPGVRLRYPDPQRALYSRV